MPRALHTEGQASMCQAMLRVDGMRCGEPPCRLCLRHARVPHERPATPCIPTFGVVCSYSFVSLIID